MRALFILLTAGVLTATPVYVRNISGSSASAPCAGSVANWRPADCAVEGGGSALLPAGSLFGIAESRAGSRTLSGDWEVGVSNGAGANQANAQFAWVSGFVNPFEVSYDPNTATIIHKVGTGPTMVQVTRVISNPTARPVRDIFIRTLAQAGRGLDTAIAVTDIRIVQNGTAYDLTGVESRATQNNPSRQNDYAWIGGLDASSPFTMTGNVTMSWTSGPNGSNLAYQIKIGEAVPEPGTLQLGIGAGLLAICYAWRRRVSA